ncbi:MAG: excinuclease ABC subunit UvrC, partial [Anaerolineae bacterium]
QDAVLKGLHQEMEGASEALEFESAARTRDRIRAIERASQDQRAIFKTRVDQDVIALARRNGEACAQVFFVRGGRLINRESFILEGTENEEEREVLTSFVKQFYDGVAYVPSEVLLSEEVSDGALIQEWLETRRGSRVALSTPRRGKKRSLVKMAAENAALTLAHLEARGQAEEAKALESLTELQAALRLEESPSRIEAFDISNIQGRLATGSMVVFTDGQPDKNGYRRFKIRTVDGSDDYAMMREVLRRRFAHALTEGQEARDGSEWTHLPDLLLIDGGAGQLGAALEVLEEQGLYTIPTVALAKREEEIYAPGRKNTIRLEPGSGALHLVQRVRDEAHRFALGYHRTLRRKAGVASALDEIPGVGPKRKKALLRQFGSVDAIRAASLQELATVTGMNEAVAQRVKDLL